MPVVQIDLFKGRTIEQKRAMVEKVTEALIETTNCTRESVSIVIRDMERHDYARGGELNCDKVNK